LRLATGARQEEGTVMTVPASLDTFAVIGNGLIGHGMAQTFAGAGQDVVMIGRSEDSLAGALDKIAKSLAQFEAHGLVIADEARAALARIRTSTKLEDAATAQLVCEAVPANKALQDELYGKLDAICAPPMVTASGSGQPAIWSTTSNTGVGSWPPISGIHRN
jgi:3-hydroxybutyryl-CoA dehydrogenase